MLIFLFTVSVVALAREKASQTLVMRKEEVAVIEV